MGGACWLTCELRRAHRGQTATKRSRACGRRWKEGERCLEEGAPGGSGVTESGWRCRVCRQGPVRGFTERGKDGARGAERPASA